MVGAHPIRRRTLLKAAVGLVATAPVIPAAAAELPPGPVARYMDSIWQRPQNGGDFTIRNRYGQQGDGVDAFVIAYRSDTLTITGLLCLPAGQGDGPWPTLLINHGHFAFNAYDTGYDTLREDLFFAANGYATIATDYRNYAGSDTGEYQLEPGYTYDVRNLLDAIRFVAPVDTRRVGMMGHSMGGGITQQVLVTT
ncbi:MAG: alpha/beta fold hydrolase, partial [Thermomicrobia bacterium]|nr:alpha/beta fold hydrolase [Thermomicrobia bacterium]